MARGAVAVCAGVAAPICAYVPVGSEPGTVALLDALRQAGHEVLLPVLPGNPSSSPSPLDWAPYLGPECLEAGPFGLRQPRTSRLGPGGISTAGVILIPALAVDQRGIRLGQGGGWYDASLPLAGPATRLVGVVRDEEWVPALPAEPHDVPITEVLTPSAGLTIVSA